MFLCSVNNKVLLSALKQFKKI